MSVGNVPALIDKEDLPLCPVKSIAVVYHTLGSRHITICGSLLWFRYVSLEVKAVTLCSAYCLCKCFRKLSMIRSISNTAASISFLLSQFIIIVNLSMSNHLAHDPIIHIAVEFTSFMADE